ncbi:MAG: hypothetical protein J07AB43_08900 [Candidatus Nanosalina sp. J07AB43]|nr:MAG: hypothetical protein J07AB43_08900 [Candidatus Nanosalina sp. J07AB43]
MDYRNQKVESDSEFPASYQANVHGSGNPSQDAFYNAHTDSNIQMTIEPGTGFEEGSNLLEAIQQTEDAETILS